MEAHVEDVGPCKRKITVQVPAENVTEKFDENYENLRKNIDLPGFRRGHVPRRLLERRFADDVAKEVRQAILEESYEKAVSDNELEVVGLPDFDEEKFDQPAIDHAFNYSVVVEVKPAFDIPDYTRLALQKAPVQPTEKELQSRIDYYRHQMATNEVVEDGALKDDQITVEIRFEADGEVIWKREEAVLSVGRDEILGVAIEGLTDELTGVKTGDAKTFEAALPDTFPLEDHRGKNVKIPIEVKEVRRPVLPDATDQWAEEIGFDSLGELKEELGNQITRLKESEAREGLKRQIRDQLAGAVAMDLPEDLMKRVIEDNDKRLRSFLTYQRLEEEEIEKRMAEQAEEGGEVAEKNVKLHFIFDAIAKKETILVTEDELRARADQLASNYDVEPDKFWETLNSEKRLDSIRRDILDEKIVDLLIEKAIVEEAPPEEDATERAQDAPEEGKTTE
jgi:trigger factor